MPENDQPLPFRNNNLYLLLSTLHLPNQWHWSLFICISHPWGQLYNATNPHTYWELEELMTETVAESKEVLAAIELATLPDEESILAVHNILKSVPVLREGGFVEKWGEEFNCRVWVKEALERLIEDGVVDFEGVGELEERAVAVARWVCSMGMRELVGLENI